jgi:hypothetical protein
MARVIATLASRRAWSAKGSRRRGHVAARPLGCGRPHAVGVAVARSNDGAPRAHAGLGAWTDGAAMAVARILGAAMHVEVARSAAAT